MKYLNQVLLALLLFLSAEVEAGAWAVGAFENDDALDFIWEVQNGDPPEPLSSPFKHAHHSDGYIEAGLGSRILAAAETYAALNGKPSPDLPADFAEWLAKQQWGRDLKLVGSAENAVKMVLDIESSELAQLWRESPEDYEAWVKSVEDLLSRLKLPAR